MLKQILIYAILSLYACEMFAASSSSTPGAAASPVPRVVEEVGEEGATCWGCLRRPRRRSTAGATQSSTSMFENPVYAHRSQLAGPSGASSAASASAAGGGVAAPSYRGQMRHSRGSSIVPSAGAATSRGDSSTAIGMSSTAAPDSGVEYSGSPLFVPRKKMGIEVETSALKVQTINHDGFSIGGPAGWEIIEDTTDHSFANNERFKGFNRNIECRTKGGQSFEEIKENVLQIGAFLQTVYSRAQNDPKLLTVDSVRELLRSSADVTLLHRECADSFEVIAQKRFNNPSIQISYQTPLADIERIFRRLGELEHHRILEFLNVIDGTMLHPSGDELKYLLTDESLDESNYLKGEQIKAYFLDNIAPKISNKIDGNLRGFCYLFLYYWYSLFNDIRIKRTPEYLVRRNPGPKLYLPIMSRVPLSQLYDTILTDTEKGLFVGLMDPLVHSDFGLNCKLREYVNDISQPVAPDLTLTRWYNSIVNPESRAMVNNRRVDSLSPPPAMDSTFSMGFYNVDENLQGCALVEVRGYGRVLYDGREKELKDIIPFTIGEADWFFVGCHGKHPTKC